MRVYVLLYNVGTDNEGIHTLKLKDPNAEGSFKDVVLAFEREDDATRFAVLLEAQDFPAATVEMIDKAEVEAFCEDAGLELQYVSEGMLAIPPAANLESTDWSPDQKPVNLPVANELPDLEEIKRRLEKLL